MCVCVCVCVCERERERERVICVCVREREREWCVCVCVCVCVCAGPCRDLWRGRCSKYKRGTWNTAFNRAVLLADMCIEMDASILKRQQMP